MEPRKHWDSVYETHAVDAVSWYAAHLDSSLAYIRRTGLPTHAAVIDVGGGEATLVDDLIEAGHTDLTVLDISRTALEVSRKRLGTCAAPVEWIAADVLSHAFSPHRYDIWHDRAVFHFLTSDDERRGYVDQVLRALKPGGFAIVGAFGPHGPTQCSGLPVVRYAPEELHGTFGARFRLMDSKMETHVTPAGRPQEFTYCFCRLDH